MSQSESLCINSLDSDNCVDLAHVLTAFNAAINEEQCWALCHQSLISFQIYYNRYRDRDNNDNNDSDDQRDAPYLLTEPKHIYLHKDGSVHQKTINSNNDGCARVRAQNQNELISSFGYLVFRALDYGLCEDEERSLSPQLEQLIEAMTSSVIGNGLHERDEETRDEGIDCYLGDDHEMLSFDNNFNSFDKYIQMTIERLPVPSRDLADNHYKAVCRALVAETQELTTFLDQIKKGMKELRQSSSSSAVVIESRSSGRTSAGVDTSLDCLEFEDWARLWIQVIRQLRESRLSLRKVILEERHPSQRATPIEQRVYELTPYEMLLDDIRLRRYKLNKVMIDGRLPQRVKKDAHALILDFIRSRPPLQSVAKRQLRPPPDKHVTLYDKLMQSIRQRDHKLRPTLTHTLDPHSSSTSTEVETSRTKLSDNELTPAPRRRLIKADLNLRLSNSFDDEEEEEDIAIEDNTKEEEIKPEEEEEVKEDKNLEKVILNNKLISKKFSLKKLSLRLLSHERRHSITVCESPLNDRKLEPEVELDVNEDRRNHIESIWESYDWGKALECLSLTLQEVQHIRNVLTKAEIETLAVTKDLRYDLEHSKICFTCLKTRFSFFGPWPQICKLCERAICERCATKMHIPCEQFEKVPIYMLSPTPSPPDPPQDSTRSDWSTITRHKDKEEEEEKESKSLPQMSVSCRKRSRLMRALTRDTDSVLVDCNNHSRIGPLVRVCRDCKILVRHLIDSGHSNFRNSTVATGSSS